MKVQYTGKITNNRDCLWEGADVRFNKDFKGATKNTFKELKETMLKEAKEVMMAGSGYRFKVYDYNFSPLRLSRERDRNDNTEPNENSGVEKCNNKWKIHQRSSKIVLNWQKKELTAWRFFDRDNITWRTERRTRMKKNAQQSLREMWKTSKCTNRVV